MEQGKKINQFGDYEDTSDMSCDDWSARWNKSQTQFHVPKQHPMLEKHYSALTEGKSSSRIFLPLCGKSIDMKWLANKGHEVVGCECADLGCREFFEEQDIPYTTEPMTGIDGLIYKSKSKLNITIYRCDYFELTSKLIGTFDCIWDRGSFVAIGVHNRQRYVDVTLPLLKKNSKYLLDCFLVDNDIFGGPPFNCDHDDVEKYFGGRCNLRKLDSRDAKTKWQEECWGVSSFIEEVYMLTPK